MENYKTLTAESSAELITKKSIFVARAAPVNDESAALSFIESVKKNNREANHNVYAYRVGIGSIYEKYSDDGEPSGTAGLPVLSVLKKEDITNAVVVVMRYFGGIMLGAGGLVRAYGAACKAGVDAAGIAVMRLMQILSVTVPYAYAGKIQREAEAGFSSCGFIIKDVYYTENVEFIIHTPADDAERFIRSAADMTNGSATVIENDNIYTSIGGGSH